MNTSKKIEFTFIDTEEKLQQAAKEWEKEDEFGIDLEMENGLHHYGCYTALIQMSSRTKNWIIDPLTIKDLKPFIKLLENPHKLKIFHDVSFDFRLLQTEFHVKPKNIFDTEKAAVFLGKTSVGLGTLLEEYFSAKKESKFQMADWTKRPIKKEMLAYAIGDTTYLLKLKDKLEGELKKKNRLEWFKEEIAKLEKADYPMKTMQFYDIRGFKALEPKEQARMKKLFELRDKLAEKVDRPTHFIMNNRIMNEVIKKPNLSLNSWAKMKGVHPIVRQRAKEFHRAIEEAKTTELNLPEKKKGKVKRFNEKQKKLVTKLSEVREELGKKFEVSPHVILSKDEIKEVVATNSLSKLMTWQRKLLEKKVKLNEKR